MCRRPGFPFLYHANFDDFSKLFCRERERNVYSFERHVLSYRSAHKIFCSATPHFCHRCGLLKVPNQTRTVTATRKWWNKSSNEQKNFSVRGFWNFAHFPVFLCKKATWNYKILCCPRGWTLLVNSIRFFLELNKCLYSSTEVEAIRYRVTCKFLVRIELKFLSLSWYDCVRSFWLTHPPLSQALLFPCALAWSEENLI